MRKFAKKALAAVMAFSVAFSLWPSDIPQTVWAADTEQTGTTSMDGTEALNKFGLVTASTSDPDEYTSNTVAPFGNSGALINPAYELLVSKAWSSGSSTNNAQEMAYDWNVTTDKSTDSSVTGNKMGFSSSANYVSGSQITETRYGQKKAGLDLDGDGVQEKIATVYVKSSSNDNKEDTLNGRALYLDISAQNSTKTTGSYLIGVSPFSMYASLDFQKRSQRSYNAGVSLATADFDGDNLDEVVFTYQGYVYVVDVTANGTCTISDATKINLPYSRMIGDVANIAVSLETGDINGDGVAELIVSQRDTIEIWSATTKTQGESRESMISNGISSMKRIVKCQPGGTGSNVCRMNAVYGDADGDGVEDLIFAYNDAKNNVYKAGYIPYKTAGNTGTIGTFDTGNNHLATCKNSSGGDCTIKSTSRKESAMETNGITSGRWAYRNDMSGVSALRYDFWYPVALAAAKLSADSDKEYVFINNAIFSYSGDGFTSVGRSDYDGHINSGDWLDGDHDTSPGITEVVAANFTGASQGVEQFMFVMAECSCGDDDSCNFAQYKYELRSVADLTSKHSYYTDNYSLTGKNTWSLDGYDDDEGRVGTQPVYVSIAKANLDKDSMYGVYKSRRLEYTNPKVIAALASTPFYSEQDVLDDGFEGDGGTSYGQATSSGTSTSESTTVSVGAYTSFEVEVSIPVATSLNVKAETESSFDYETSNEYSEMVSKEYSIEYESSGGEDSVVICTVPKMVYVYDVKVSDNNGGTTTTEMEYVVPLEPVSKVISAEKYDKIAEAFNASLKADSTEKLPVMYGDNGVFKHTIGDPTTYKDTFSSGDWYANGYVYYNEGNSSITQSITTEKETEKSTSSGFNIEASAGGGAGGAVVGVKTGSNVSSGFATVNSKSASISGSVQNAPYGEDSENYEFAWRVGAYLRDYSGSKLKMDDVLDEEKNTFVVVTYQTSQISAPPSMPINVEVSEVAEDSIKLTWEDPATGTDKTTKTGRIKASYYKLFRKAELPDSEYEEIKIVNEATEDYTTHEYQDTGLLSGVTYTYYVKAYGADDKASIASESVSGRTIRSGKTLKIAEQPADTTVCPTDDVTFSVATENEGDSTVVYQWQKSEGGSEWTNVGKTTDKASLSVEDVALTDNNTKYRVVIYQEVDGVWISTASEAATLSVAKADTTTALSLSDDVIDASNGKFNVSGTVKVSAPDGNTHIPTGTVALNVLDNDGNKLLTKDASANVNSKTGTASFSLDVTGDYGTYTITASYSGDSVFNASKEAISKSFNVARDYTIKAALEESMVYGDVYDLAVEVIDVKTGKSVDITDKGIKVQTSANLANSDYKVTAANTGDYTVTITADEMLPVTLTGTISKRAVTVTADDITRRKTDEHIAPTASFDNLASIDADTDMGVTLGCSVAQDTEVGTYDITVSGGNAHFTSCYEPTYKSGTYTVTAGLYKVTYKNPVEGEITATSAGNTVSSGDIIDGGSTVTFTVEPTMSRYRVVNWTVDGEEYKVDGKVVTDSEITLTVDADVKIGLVMESYEVPVTFTAGDGGSVTAVMDGTTVDVTSGDSIAPGTKLEFTAVPAENYVVDKWTVNGETYKVNGSVYTENALDYEVAASANEVSVTFVANEELVYYSTATEAVYDGGLSAEGVQIAITDAEGNTVETGTKVKAGTTLTATATCPANMDIRKWLINGTSYAAKTTVSFTVDADTTVQLVVVGKSTRKAAVEYSVEGNVTEEDITLTATTGTSTLASGAQIPVGQPCTVIADISKLRTKYYNVVGYVVTDSAGSKTYDYSDVFRLDSVSRDTTITLKLEHIHVYDVEKIEDEYKAGDAACTKPATYYGLCICGEHSDETFEYGDALGHVESEDVLTPATTEKDGSIVRTCTRCNEETYNETIAKIGKAELVEDDYTPGESGKTPSVTVKDANGNDISTEYYTAKYNDSRTVAGGYAVDVVFNGHYSGTVELQHVHNYNVKNATVVYKASDATCTAPATYYYVCSCGHKSSATYEYGKAVGHGSTTTKLTQATTKKSGSIVKTCSVCKKVVSKTTIARIKTVKLSKTAYYQSKAVRKPAVTVKDAKGNTISSKYYTVKYYGARKASGRYSVKIVFKGRYSGTVIKYFVIKPQAAKTKVTAGKSKTVNVKWSRVSGVSGYQIQYSTSKKFSKPKSVYVKGNTKYTKKLTKLKSKKKYYVRVRAYRNVSVNGKTVKLVGKWSKLTSVVVK